jgi:16S rRNA (uracil1498-N3)-methyltransferase
MRPGDAVRIVDGKGGLYEGVVTGEESKQCRVAIHTSVKDFEPMDYSLHVGIAATKNQDRFEWFVEKATEIGITSISPILCDHSERSRIRLDRLERIIVSAIKQSVRAYKPRISEMVTFTEWLNKRPGDGVGLIAHCGDGERQDILTLPRASEVHLAIGPEGDFSKAEIKAATGNGFIPVTLGSSRLRTETAGIVAVAAIALHRER